MKPNTLAAANSAIKVSNRMFDQAIDPEALICIALADDRGRITQVPKPSTEEFLIHRLEIFRELMAKPFVQGRDLVEAGLKPDKDFTEILAYAHKLRLAGTPKDNALKQTLAFARKLREEK
jgi:tRNA nucleotidyltransferase (CCA-adding enzyme)